MAPASFPPIVQCRTPGTAGTSKLHVREYGRSYDQAIGLQAIYSDRKIRDNVFAILREIVPKQVNPKNGRLCMDLWKILVLGTIRLNCNWDYYKIHDIANNHKTIREFLGHTVSAFDQRYALQTIKDNVANQSGCRKNTERTM